MPLYSDIAKEIEQRIIDGRYLGGTTLPDHEALASEFNTSRPTIKKAIDILTEKGFVSSSRGRGTFVLNFNHQPNPNAILDTTQTQFIAPQRIQKKLLKYETAFPDAKLQDHLKIQSYQPIYEIICLQIIDNVPSSIEHIFLPVKSAPTLSEKMITNSVYKYLSETLNLDLAGALQRMHADKADEYDIEHLNAQADDPIFELEQTIFLTTGEPVEYLKTRFRYDQGEYVAFDPKKTDQ